jgi:hypothetical protein
MDYIQIARLKQDIDDNGLCDNCKLFKEGCQAMCDGEYGKIHVVRECSGFEPI